MTQQSKTAEPRIFTVRAENGKYAADFKNGGYVAIGWLPGVDLSMSKTKDEVWQLYETAHPAGIKPTLVSNHVGQISRFLLEIKAGDHILTPTESTEWVNHGVVSDDQAYYQTADEICPYPHRRQVKWDKEPLRRSDFSIPLQNTMRSLLTVFEVSQASEIFSLLGLVDLITPLEEKALTMHGLVLERILSKDADFFELLITELLTAMGFDAEKTGKTGDGGVDSQGELDIGGLARIKLKVQAKRYQVNSKINGAAIVSFRGSIPSDAQGAFVTTSDYSKKAHEAANDPNFKRVGLVNGRQLVDLLTLYWEKLPDEIQQHLGLRTGLILV